MTAIRLIARPMLASMFIVGGVNALRQPKPHAQMAQPVTDKVVPAAKKAGAPLPSDAETLVKINGGAQVLAGLALATGRMPRVAATVLAASLVPTTAAGHRFWEESDPQQRQNQQIHFIKNVSMMGGLLLAGVDTDGKPGLAWRARHVAKDARREAKLARAQLT